MRHLLSLIAAVALFATPALAADFGWTTADVSATRFQGADSEEVGTIEAGKRVEILFTDEGRVRVKLPASSKFGWIDAASVSDTDPGAAADPDTDTDTDAP